MSCPNVKNCTCPKVQCENHSKCCACVAKHRKENRPPNCFTLAQAPQRPPKPIKL